jgi:hypothetical protein
MVRRGHTVRRGRIHRVPPRGAECSDVALAVSASNAAQQVVAAYNVTTRQNRGALTIDGGRRFPVTFLLPLVTQDDSVTFQTTYQPRVVAGGGTRWYALQLFLGYQTLDSSVRTQGLQLSRGTSYLTSSLVVLADLVSTYPRTIVYSADVAVQPLAPDAVGDPALLVYARRQAGVGPLARLALVDSTGNVQAIVTVSDSADTGFVLQPKVAIDAASGVGHLVYVRLSSDGTTFHLVYRTLLPNADYTSLDVGPPRTITPQLVLPTLTTPFATTAPSVAVVDGHVYVAVANGAPRSRVYLVQSPDAGSSWRAVGNVSGRSYRQAFNPVVQATSTDRVWLTWAQSASRSTTVRRYRLVTKRSAPLTPWLSAVTAPEMTTALAPHGDGRHAWIAFGGKAARTRRLRRH